MIDLDNTILIQLVNFIIVLLVLDMILYRPIRGILAKRAEYMKGQLDVIEEFTGSADSKLADYEAQLASARAAGTDKRNELKEEGLDAEKALMAKAGKDVMDKVSKAKSEVDAEAAAAMTALKADVKVLAEKATAKILS